MPRLLSIKEMLISLRQKSFSDVLDSFTIFIIGYLLRMLFGNSSKGLEEWRHYDHDGEWFISEKQKYHLTNVSSNEICSIFFSIFTEV